MLQLSTLSRKGPGGNNAKTSEVRKLFLEAYEKTFGNVGQSCKYAGISRQTYYRWMKSKTPVNLRFQRRVKLIEPQELVIDLAETALMKLIDEGNVKAAIYLLRTRGQGRGWGKGEPTPQVAAPSKDLKVHQVMTTFEFWLKDNPRATQSERETWLLRFALLADIPVPSLSHLNSLDDRILRPR